MCSLVTYTVQLNLSLHVYFISDKIVLKCVKTHDSRIEVQLGFMISPHDSYEERLMELNLSTLEYRRRRYDIIQVFKIIHEIDDIDMSKFFTFTDNSQLRGHNLKLNKPRVNKSIRLNSFAMRTIPVWNNLPSEIVNSKTVLEFKTKIDKLWKNARYDLSEIY